MESIPIGPVYNDSRYKTCLLPGSSTGNLQVWGDNYVHAAYGLDTSNIWIHGVATVAIWLFIVTVNTLGREFYSPSKGGFIRKVYKGGKAPKVNTAKDEENQIKLVRKAQEDIGSKLTMVCSLFMSCLHPSLEECFPGQISDIQSK